MNGVGVRPTRGLMVKRRPARAHQSQAHRDGGRCFSPAPGVLIGAAVGLSLSVFFGSAGCEQLIGLEEGTLRTTAAGGTAGAAGAAGAPGGSVTGTPTGSGAAGGTGGTGGTGGAAAMGGAAGVGGVGGGTGGSGGADCPEVCTQCDSGRCIINCGGANACATGPVACPAGWDCVVNCTGPNSCAAAIACSVQVPRCTIRCTGNGSCRGGIDCNSPDCAITCGDEGVTGACASPGAVHCNGPPNGLCHVLCEGTNACTSVVCPEANRASCWVQCFGPGTCGMIDCANTCACITDCRVGTACLGRDDLVTCPQGSTGGECEDSGFDCKNTEPPIGCGGCPVGNFPPGGPP